VIKTCEHCRQEYSARSYNAETRRFCSRACANLARPAKGYIHKRTGYRMISLGSRIAGVREEHRVVMQQILGRELLPGETVHHKNGVRDDNRPENLELWSNRHGKGHRVADQVAFAKETLAIYGDGPFDVSFIEQGRRDLALALELQGG
jgi:hypothetical protein